MRGEIAQRLATIAAVFGVGLVIVLIRQSGARTIGALILQAGPWLPLVILLHAPQTLCSALGWGALLDPPRRPGVRRLFILRWIRESVNSLLPVAQVGGDVVRARLLVRGGGKLSWALASCALDVTLELLAQVAFTLFGLGLLAAAAPRSPVLGLAALAVVLLAIVVAGLFGVQALWRAGRLQAWTGHLLRRGRAGLDQAARPKPPAFKASRGEQLRSLGWHVLSWLLGAMETWAALRALGAAASLREATVIESLGQMVRAVGFLVPGALGVQEGGFVVVCSLFGVPAASALALSLVRRIRELALGAPGLLAWRSAERSPVTARTP